MNFVWLSDRGVRLGESVIENWDGKKPDGLPE